MFHQNLKWTYGHNLIDLDIFENDKNFEVSNMAKLKKYYT